MTQGNHESSNDKRTLFWLFLQICDPCINPKTPKYVFLRFSSILWFWQFLSYFLLVLEARSKLNQLYTIFWVKRASFLASLLLRNKPGQRYKRHFSQRFQTEERILRVNKTKITDENAFNRNNFGTEGNHKSSNDEKILFWVFLEICDSCFNP